jgi:hypothetical protein
MNSQADPSSESPTVRLSPPEPVALRGPSGARMTVGISAVCYGLFLLNACLGNPALATIPFAGYLPGSAWIPVMEEPVGALILANALYAAFGLIAWYTRSKTMAAYFVVLPLLGSLMFVFRFAAEMGAAFR